MVYQQSGNLAESPAMLRSPYAVSDIQRSVRDHLSDPMSGNTALLVYHILSSYIETPFDFDWDEAFARLATLPRQEEWETYMSIFQVARPGATSAEKWRMMERIFHLY